MKDLATRTRDVLLFSSGHRWMQDAPDEQESSSDDDRGPLGIFAAVMSSILLFLLIFGLSATVDMGNLRKQLRNKFALGTGVAMQFLIMPILGFVAVMALKEAGLSQAMGLTLLVVTSSPGGSYSNWWCSTFNADLALSVAMTALSTILSVGLLPANLFLYTYLAYGLDDDSEDDEMEEDVIHAIDFGALFLSLGIVIAAIVSGLFASYKVNNVTFNKWANKGGTVAGVLLIVFSAVIGSGTGDSESSFFSHGWYFYVGVAFPCLVGLALANLIARCFLLEKPEVVAISVECCYQNVGIATSVAITMFDDPTTRAEAVAVPLFYGIVEAVVLGIYCVVSWKLGWTKAPKDEKLCVVVSTTYEVSESSQEEEEEGGGDEEENSQEDSQEEFPQEDFVPDEPAPPQQQKRGFFGWLSALFRPRASESTAATELEKDGANKAQGGDRSRLVSEDYTAKTSDTEGSNNSSMTQSLSHSGMDVELCLESIQEATGGASQELTSGVDVESCLDDTQQVADDGASLELTEAVEQSVEVDKV